jgi:DNA-binding protein Fis
MDLDEPRTTAIERALAERAMEDCDGNMSAAARLLNLNRKALERMVKRYGIQP